MPKIGLWALTCVPPPDSSNEAAAAAGQRRKGFEYAREHLGRVPVVMTVRVLRAWDLYQPWDTAVLNEGRPVTIARIGLVVYWLLLPGAIVGVLLLRARGTMLRVLLAPVLLVVVSTILGWGVTRFRHPAEIAIVIFAAVAISAGLDQISSARSRQSP